MKYLLLFIISCSNSPSSDNDILWDNLRVNPNRPQTKIEVDCFARNITRACKKLERGQNE